MRRLRRARALGVEVVEVSLPDLPYERADEHALRGSGGRVRGPDALRSRRHAHLAGRRRLAQHLPQGALSCRPSTTSSSTACAIRSCWRSTSCSARSTRVIGPFMTGPMLIASNFTGHPCLHLRAGFLELGNAQRRLARLRQADDGRARRPRAALSRFPRASRCGGGCSRKARSSISAWRSRTSWAWPPLARNFRRES